MSNQLPPDYQMNQDGSYGGNSSSSNINFNSLTYEQQQNILNERRKYPQHFEGGKDEWIAMEQHHHETAKELESNQIQIRELKKKTLITELERKQIELLQRRNQELLQRQREGDEVLRLQQAYETVKDDKLMIQNQLGNFYGNQKREQFEREQAMKQAKLDYENAVIQFNRQRLRSEEDRRQRIREDFKNDTQFDLMRAHQNHEVEKQIRLQDREESIELMKRNAEREITKQENYKNFYRICAENQAVLQDRHFHSVQEPLLKRQRELEDIIKKNVSEADRKRAEYQLSTIMQRQMENIATRDRNLGMISDHNNRKEIQKLQKQQLKVERLEDMQNYQQFLEFKKKQKFDKKNQYKTFLDQQKNEKNLNGYRMTRIEKGINKFDLQAYKQHDNASYSMLPGWSPQLGQLPHRENREMEYKRVQQKYTIRPDQSMPNLNINQSYLDSNSNGLGKPNQNYPVDTNGENLNRPDIPNSNSNANNNYNNLQGGQPNSNQANNIYYNNAGSSSSQALPPNQNYGFQSSQTNQPYNLGTVRGSNRDRGFLSKAAENSLNSYNNFQSPPPVLPNTTRNNNKYGTGLGHNIFGINYNSSTVIPN